jgi:hypothetical protein
MLAYGNPRLRYAINRQIIALSSIFLRANETPTRSRPRGQMGYHHGRHISVVIRCQNAS